MHSQLLTTIQVFGNTLHRRNEDIEDTTLHYTVDNIAQIASSLVNHTRAGHLRCAMH